MARILLVEPDDGVAGEMAHVLAMEPDWHVVRAGSLLEAIRVAGEATFDAAILDSAQPDGAGVDILDFLRISSPGIRILLVSDGRSEGLALHALSHGVGDLLVKDSHLCHELPRRVDALLDGGGARGRDGGPLVETLAAARYEEPPPPLPVRDVRALPAASDLDRTLRAIVGGSVLAVAVYDARGRPLGVRLDDGIDADGLGFALATIHGQVGALWTYGQLKPTGYEMLIDVDAGLLAVTAIPGTYIVTILLDADTPHGDALEHLERTARSVFETLHAD